MASRSGQQDQDEDDDDDENEDEDEQTRAAMMEGCAGFQGRANKPLDACYSFWSLGALSVRLRVPPRLFSPRIDRSESATLTFLYLVRI